MTGKIATPEEAVAEIERVITVIRYEQDKLKPDVFALLGLGFRLSVTTAQLCVALLTSIKSTNKRVAALEAKLRSEP